MAAEIFSLPFFDFSAKKLQNRLKSFNNCDRIKPLKKETVSAMIFEPDVLKFSDGRQVTAENWQERRNEIIDILRREEYGYSPLPPEKVTGEVISTDKKCCAGHAELEKINISFETQKGIFTFPINFFVAENEKRPLIVMLNFRPEAYDRYFPAEEIIDNGFNLAVIYYQDISSDNGDFSNGIAAMYDRPAGTGWGKISMWAFAASRAVDYLVTRDEVDAENIAVAGHSRLGKTALWCGAQDERIKYVYSNDSGCCGAAYEREKHANAEDVDFITKTFPYWFCENFHKYAKCPEKRPFDQHFLIAASAPRFVCVGSASKDDWADQYSEQLSCTAASPVWEMLGLRGFAADEKPFEVGQSSLEGCIGYHLRDGIHFFSRNDWQQLMTFIKNKRK